jgi:hypothetical protein
MRDPMVRPGLQRDALQQSSSQLNSGWTKKNKKNKPKTDVLTPPGTAWQAQPSLTTALA